MHGYIDRLAESSLVSALQRAPVTAILGARQCGKSTLAHEVLSKQRIPHVFLDLQDRADRNKLREPELFFERRRDRLLCLDEVQLAPELFPALRVEVDRDRRPGRFLILGSASRELIRQPSPHRFLKPKISRQDPKGRGEGEDFHAKTQRPKGGGRRSL